MASTVPALSRRLRRLQSFIAHNPVVSTVAEARCGDIVIGTHSGTFHCDEVLSLLATNVPIGFLLNAIHVIAGSGLRTLTESAAIQQNFHRALT